MIKHKTLFGKSDSVLHKLFWDCFWVMLASELSVAVSKLIDSLMVSNFMATFPRTVVPNDNHPCPAAGSPS